EKSKWWEHLVVSIVPTLPGNWTKIRFDFSAPSAALSNPKIEKPESLPPNLACAFSNRFAPPPKQTDTKMVKKSSVWLSRFYVAAAKIAARPRHERTGAL